MIVKLGPGGVFKTNCNTWPKKASKRSIYQLNIFKQWIVFMVQSNEKNALKVCGCILLMCSISHKTNLLQLLIAGVSIIMYNTSWM